MTRRPIDFDTVLDLCRARHRRIVLATLADERRSVTTTDLAEAVVRHDLQTSITEVSDEVLADIRLDLHHVHVPQLVEAGIVEYDPERNVVELTERFDRIEPRLSAVIDADPELEPPLAV